MPIIKISVIIPFYNEEKYISECLESVISQTLKDIEIICVDDGSTDSSLRIVTEYLKKDKRINLLNGEKRGGGAARNIALKKAKGQFVAFLDSDDYYLDNKSLELLYETANRKNVLVCGGLRKGIGKDKRIKNQDLYRNICNINTGTIKVLYRDYQHDFHYHSYIFSKKLIDKLNIKFSEKCKFQDPPFFVRIMFYAKEYYLVPVEFYCYRSITLNQKYWEKAKILAVVEGLKDNLIFSKEQGLDILHWLSAMRINNEYSKPIFKHINNKEDSVFIALNNANNALCTEMISKIQNGHIPYDKLYGVLSPMDNKLIEYDKTYNRYYLEPLKMFLTNTKEKVMVLNVFKKTIKGFYGKIKGGIYCLKEYGLARTLEIILLQFSELFRIAKN